MISAWLYPWDLAASGVDATLEELAALGVDGLAVSATYHPIAATSMRPSGPRPFHSAEGEVLFVVDAARYAESAVTPLVLDHARTYGFWSGLGATARAAGLSFDAWIVTVFQPWLARRRPDAARTYPDGALNLDAVCPLAPRYQSYLRALVGDVVTRSEPDRVVLENLLFTPFDYGWIRPRTLVEVSTRAAQLLGLCFCAGCSATGTDAGLDVPGFRAEVVRRVGAELAASAPAAGSDTFDDELQMYLDCRSVRLGRYVADLADEVRQISPSTGLVTWAAEGYGQAQLAPALAESVDTLLVHHESSLPAVRAAADRPHARPLRLMRLLYVLRSLGGADEQRLANEANAATAAGYDEFALYNWGLVPKENFARSVEICRAAQPPVRV